MKRKIERKYELNIEEVKYALLYWMCNAKDWPVPHNYDDASLTWNGEQTIFIAFSEELAD